MQNLYIDSVYGPYIVCRTCTLIVFTDLILYAELVIDSVYGPYIVCRTCTLIVFTDLILYAELIH